MARENKCAPQARQRPIRMFREHEPRHGSRSLTIRSIAEKFVDSADTLRSWLKQADIIGDRRDGVLKDERTRTKGLERENRDLRWANEILPKTSAYLAQAEHYRRPK